MPEWLKVAVSNGDELPISVLFVRLVAAFALGGAVALIYAVTQKRTGSYQPAFVTTLVLLSILIAAVTLVIGTNVARAFSLVGALAIVRFRTIVADTRDTAFVIFAVVEGMAVGAGHFTVAIAGLAVAGVASFVVRPRPAHESTSWRLTMRVGIGHDLATLAPVLARHFASQDLISTTTARQGAAMELSYTVSMAPGATPGAAIAALNATPGVQQVDLIRI